MISAPPLTLAIPRRVRIFTGQVRRASLTMVGAGGTGSFLALHLARLAYDARERHLLDELRLTFVDPDKVEAGNLGRQNFVPAELGRFKAETLANRYSRAFGLTIRYVNAPFQPEHVDTTGQARDLWLHLVIGCVDNTAARADILKTAKGFGWNGRLWWLDCGNHDHSGQVLLGNKAGLKGPQVDPLGWWCTALPLPSDQHPELVEKRKARPAPETSCTNDLAAGYQSLMVNQQVAGLAASYVYRLLVGRDLDIYATYFDLQAGNAYSEYILEA